MDYISGFGIAFAVPILALAVLTPNEGVHAAAGVDVDVSVSNMRNIKGQLMVCLTKNPKAFPDCSKDAGAHKKLVPAKQAADISFTDIAPGTYAIAIVHDENSNNRMDMAIFIPKEGFAFSRDPKIGMGPPKFKSAAFVVGAANVRQSAKMKYMF